MQKFNFLGTNNRRLISIIFLFGLAIRILFLLFGAEIYFGREYFYIDGDTGMFADPIINLIEHGSYSGNLSHEDGYFSRVPGYPFFIGIFYLLSGKAFPLTYELIIWTQVFFDAFCIIIIYKIGAKVFSNSRIPIILSFIYATYPFIIVWNPIVYAESISIFFFLISILYFVNKDIKYNYFYSGIFLSIALLTRPQIALLIPCYFIALVYCYRSN
ncbi:glycosyltransferase family 39 protein, partial [bacterium AH-315-M05]|nr:glycosyltransferase family 39 protein [bacterium AH-315-M05]